MASINIDYLRSLQGAPVVSIEPFSPASSQGSAPSVASEEEKAIYQRHRFMKLLDSYRRLTERDGNDDAVNCIIRQQKEELYRDLVKMAEAFPELQPALPEDPSDVILR